MSVAIIGTTRLEPFLNPGVGEPLGTLIGAVTGAGDASGGTLGITFTLGAFVYIVRLIGTRMTAGAGQNIQLSLTTGYAPGGSSEIFGTTIVLGTVGTGETGHGSYIPPSIYAQPRDNNVVVNVALANPGVGVTVGGGFRALVFPENVLQVSDPSLLARFLI